MTYEPGTRSVADEHQPMAGMRDVQCTCLKWRGNDHSRHLAALEGEQQ